MASTERSRIRKKDLKGLERIYGNGSVYISDGHMVAELPGHNFDIVSLEDVGPEYWMTDGVAVSLGVDTNKRLAILALRKIIRRIQKTEKQQFNPVAPF